MTRLPDPRERFALFPEHETVVDESKRKPPAEVPTEPQWRKLARVKGRRPVCSACALERWRGERADVERVTYRRTDPSGEWIEYCDDHAKPIRDRDKLGAPEPDEVA